MTHSHRQKRQEVDETGMHIKCKPSKTILFGKEYITKTPIAFFI